MNKKILIAMVLMLVILTAIPRDSLSLEQGKIIFCSNITDDWKPVGENASFETNIISWISHATNAYGKQTVTLTVYIHEGAKEQLYKRETLNVRPTWDTTAMRNMVLPKAGKYTLTLDLPDGTSISSGTVTITQMQATAGPAAAPVETLGTSLADLFNQYKSKK